MGKFDAFSDEMLEKAARNGRLMGAREEILEELARREKVREEIDREQGQKQEIDDD